MGRTPRRDLCGVEVTSLCWGSYGESPKGHGVSQAHTAARAIHPPADAAAALVSKVLGIENARVLAKAHADADAEKRVGRDFCPERRAGDPDAEHTILNLE